MANIYELTGNYLKVMQLIESGELDEEMLKDTLEAVEGNLEEKAESYGYIIKNLEGQANMLDAEISRLQERSMYFKGKAATMQQTVYKMMEVTKKDSVVTDHFNYGFRKSKSVNVLDEKLLPKEYIATKTKVTKSADKKAIKKAIDSGVKVPGAEIKENKNWFMK